MEGIWDGGLRKADETLAEFKGDNLSVKMFGAKGDLVFGADGVATAGAAAFTSVATSFTSSDITKAIWIEGAGPGGGTDHLTTIADFVDAHTVTLASPPVTAVSGARFRYGTDDTSAITSAFETATSRGQRLRFPYGAYATTASLTPLNNLCITGAGYTHDPHNEARVSAQIVCLAPVPVINYTAASLLSSFHVEGLTLRGTTRSGSKGIYLSSVFGVMMRDVTFDTFGDQALQIDFGVDGRLEHVFAQNAMLVRTGRTAYVGVIDVLVHDVIMDNVQSSCSIGFGTVIGGSIGDGFIAGIAIRGTNCYAHSLMGHLSQVGIYVSPASSFIGFVNSRADLNQGQGWIVDASGCLFTGCRSHANSLDTNGAYSAFLMSGGGNKFTACQASYNGDGGAAPIYHKVKAAFETTTGSDQEANHFFGNSIYPNCYTVSDYLFSGTQKSHVIADCTNLDPNGRATFRIRGDVSIRDSASIILQSTGPVDGKVWSTRMNYGTGFSELLHSILSDNYSGETGYMLVSRTGMTVNFTRITQGNLEVVAGDLKVQSNAGEIILTDSIGTPRSIKRDYGGTGFTSYASGDLLVGNSGSGLDRLAAGTGFLNALSGAISWLKVALTNANHVDVSSLTDQQPVIRNGSALGSASGVTATDVLVTSLNITQGTINYASGANSFTAVTAITNNTKSQGFTNGVLTSNV